MAGEVKAVPEGTHAITAHLIVNNGAEALVFYKNAFNAEILTAKYTSDGKLLHANLKVGDAQFMLADEFPGRTAPSARSLGDSCVVLNLYADKIDEMFDRAVRAGAVVTMPLANQFWGDRYGQLQDPFGHRWALGQHVEDLSAEELERRSKEAFAKFAESRGRKDT